MTAAPPAEGRGRSLRRLAPGSLRGQLLARTLLLLAALLVLIGLMQDWLMKDSLYRSKADSLRSQLMTMPVGWFEDGSPGRQNAPPAGGGTASGGAAAGGTAGKDAAGE
ncbi:hypothetical protein I8J29_33355, partial [Paenibacillus sp. MWE-103]|nr:hypothetical protein [Paenibacillus artemisiicola]